MARNGRVYAIVPLQSWWPVVLVWFFVGVGYVWPLPAQAQNVEQRLLTAARFPVTPAASNGCQPDGNVNQDDTLTPADALLAFRQFLGIANPPLDACQQVRANVVDAETSAITPADALCIFRRFLGLASCLDALVRPARLEAVEGDGTGVFVDQTQRLVVRVTNALGRPVEGVTVHFRVVEPAAGTRRLSTSEATTGTNGQAETLLTVDQRAGANRVEAGTEGLEPVIFSVTGCFDTGNARLVRLGGNSQNGQPGQELRDPFVVRMEDQFGNPGVGQTLEIDPGERAEVTAVLSQGAPGCEAATARQQKGRAARVVQAGGRRTVVTDARGEARFLLRINEGAGEEDFTVQVAAPGLPQVEPAQFLVIVGAIDTPDIPLDLAVAGDFVLIADRFSGLQVADVSDCLQPARPRPCKPVLLHAQAPLNLPGTEMQLAIDATLAYVATAFPGRLYILDIANPRDAGFPTQTNSNCEPNKLPGCVQFPAALQSHVVTGMTVQRGFVYLVTQLQAAQEAKGTLQVIDVRNRQEPQIVGSVELTGSRPLDVAVSGNVAYVSAGGGGLLLVDVSDPANPAVLADRTLGTAADQGFFSSIVLRDGFAYTIESRCNTNCNSLSARLEENIFTVFDLSTPTIPQRRGAKRLRGVGPLAVAGRFAYLVQFAFGLRVIDINDPDDPKPLSSIDTPSVALSVATAGEFVYVADQIFGLQVIEGSPSDAPDTDGDGVIDRFDAFPRDPTVSQDTDRDGLADDVDPDDDNDGFLDTEEEGDLFADPKNPRIFPPGAPAAGLTRLVIDATTTVPPRDRHGSETAPYGSLTEAVLALQKHGQKQVRTVVVKPGIYSPLTSQEIFPISFAGLRDLTLQSADAANPEVVARTVIDAGFSGDIFLLVENAGMTIDGLTLVHGGHGIRAFGVTGMTIRRNIIAANISDGIVIGIDSMHPETENRITDNAIHSNGLNGVQVFERSQATITRNQIGEIIDDDAFCTQVGTGVSGADTVLGNAGQGIFVAVDARATITANEVMCNGVGIDVALTSDATVTGNTIVHNTLLGVVIRLTSAATISGNNRVRFNGGANLFFAPPPVAEFADALLFGVGLAVDGGSTAVITGNTVDTNLFGGIVVERNAKADILENNIRGNGLVIAPNGFGIVLFDNPEADVTMVTDNTISGNGGSGVAIAGAPAEITRNDILQNGLVGFGGVGIIVVNSVSTALTDNDVQANVLDGIVVQAASAAIRGGTISGNGRNGILLFGAARADIGPNGNVVTVSENFGAGIFVTVDGSVAGISSDQAVVDCVLFDFRFFPPVCVQFAFRHVFTNVGGDFVPPLDFVFGPYVQIP